MVDSKLITISTKYFTNNLKVMGISMDKVTKVQKQKYK